MKSFSIGLDPKRPYRYAFSVDLWNIKLKKFGKDIDVLLDTGAFNTFIHNDLVGKYGIMLKRTMSASLDGKEHLSGNAATLEYPYRYCYNNKGLVMALQDMD